MYKIHKDHANGKWNVFFEKDGKQEFFAACDSLDEALDLCVELNTVKA